MKRLVSVFMALAILFTSAVTEFPLTAAAHDSPAANAYAQTTETPIIERFEERMESAARMSFTVDGVTYLEQNDGTLAITGYSGNAKDIIILSELDGQRITRINANAFRSCKSLERIFIPESIEYIETTMRGASYEQGMPFSSCENLTEIVVESTNARYCSEDGILFNKDKTELITYPAARRQTKYDIPKSVRSICNHAFAYCKYLTSVTIPNDIEVITDFTFYRCYALKSIIIPNSVKKIGYYAFGSCDNLVSAVIPYGVAEIGDLAFSYCKSLLSVTVPESVTSLGQGVFDNCSSLGSASILANINCIDSTFRFCSNLETVVIPESVNVIYGDTFYRADKLKDIYFIGTKSQWAKMSIGDDNDPLKEANITCYYVPPVCALNGTSTSNSVTLNWAINHTADSYKIEQFVNGTWKELVKITDNAVTSYTVNDLQQTTAYEFAVYALKGTNCSAATKITVKTPVALPATVSGFTGTAFLNSIILKWNKSANAAEYKLQQSINGAWQTIASPTETTYTVTGLNANTAYDFRIFARNSNGQSAQTKLSISTIGMPAAVTNFSGTAGTDSITLMWNKSANAAEYKLQQSINGAWQTIASPTETTYTVTGLNANTAYNFRIFARNGSLQSDQNKLTVSTIGTPTAVTNFSGTAGANSITLKWNKSAGAAEYKLQQMINGGWQTIATPTGTTYTVSGLKANTAYNFRIFARNESGQGVQTKLAVTTLVGAPSAVTGFTGTAAANSITLKWNKSTDATEYKLQQMINGGWQTIATPSGTTYTVTGLKANAAYNFRIFARNGSLQSAQTKLTVTTAGAPENVAGFMGVAKTNSIVLNWYESANATEYKLQQMINGNWQTIAMPTGTSFTVTGLSPKTTYNFRIFARNGSLQSDQIKLTVKTS